MKINNIIYKGTLLAASVAMLVSCSDFLDTNQARSQDCLLRLILKHLMC